MSHIPSELKYATSHEWIRVEANGEAVVGITEHAQELLGDMVFVELPEVGKQVSAGDDCAVAESVKAASDIYSPVSGEIIAVNEELEGSPSWSTPTPTALAGCSASSSMTRASWPTCWMPKATRTWWTKSNAPGPCQHSRAPLYDRQPGKHRPVEG